MAFDNIEEPIYEESYDGCFYAASRFAFICLMLLLAGTSFGQGVKRWSVKTCQDNAPLTLRPVNTTIREQCLLPRPAGKWLTLPRQKNEDTLYRIQGMITDIGTEQDGDIHAVLSNGRISMVVEIPNPTLMPFGDSHANLYTAERNAIDSVFHGKEKGRIKAVKPVPVTLEGYGFFDENGHLSKGHATNFREIHPAVWMKF